MPENPMDVPPEMLASLQDLPSEMTEDLKRVSGIPEELARQISTELYEATGVSTPERVKEIVGNHVDEEIANAVARTLLNIAPEHEQLLVELLDKWRRSSDERRALVSDEVIATLDRNLKILIQDYPALYLMRKAHRLLRDVGNEFGDVLFVCDLRPVFDQEHKTVEGFVALANLRLRYIRQNGDRETFELALTEQELQELMTAARDAMQKLNILKRSSGDLFH